MSEKDDEMQDQRRRWYVDKSIPLPLLGMLTVQTLLFAFWLGGVSRDVQDQGKKINEVAARMNDLNKVDVQLAEFRLRMTYFEAENGRLSERVSAMERLRGLK
jgi:hypothetical protein